MPIDLSAFPENPPRRDDATVVALLLPIGDERANIRALAGDLYNAAQLALFDSGNASIVLKLHDTKGTPTGLKQPPWPPLPVRPISLSGRYFRPR